MQFAAVLGALLTVVSFLLPNTPPSKEVKDPWAFTKSFALFKMVPGFTVFMLDFIRGFHGVPVLLHAVRAVF